MPRASNDIKIDRLILGGALVLGGAATLLATRVASIAAKRFIPNSFFAGTHFEVSGWVLASTAGLAGGIVAYTA